MTANDRIARVCYVILALCSVCAVLCAMPTVASAYVPTVHAPVLVGSAYSIPVHSASVDSLPVRVLPLCEEEDASGLNDGPVCRWDASAAGLANGGSSFTAFRMASGNVLYVHDNGAVEISG